MKVTKGYYTLTDWHDTLGTSSIEYTQRIKYITIGCAVYMQIEVLSAYTHTLCTYPWWKFKSNITELRYKSVWLPEEAFIWNPETREEIVCCAP